MTHDFTILKFSGLIITPSLTTMPKYSFFIFCIFFLTYHIIVLPLSLSITLFYILLYVDKNFKYIFYSLNRNAKQWSLSPLKLGIELHHRIHVYLEGW